VDDIAVRVITAPRSIIRSASVHPHSAQRLFDRRDDACDPSHPGHRLEGARAVLGAHHAVPLQAVNLHPALPGPPDLQGARGGAPPPKPVTRCPQRPLWLEFACVSTLGVCDGRITNEDAPWAQSFTASDRFVHTQSVMRAVKTPDALRRQANWTAPPQPKWTGV
jgi:hypothetical protein